MENNSIFQNKELQLKDDIIINNKDIIFIKDDYKIT